LQINDSQSNFKQILPDLATTPDFCGHRNLTDMDRYLGTFVHLAAKTNSQAGLRHIANRGGLTF